MIPTKPTRLRFTCLFLILCSVAIAQGLPNFVQSQYPQPNATGVARNSAIAIRFSPAIDTYNAKFTLNVKSGVDVPLTQVRAGGDSTSSEFVYRPSATLSILTTYSFAVSAPGIAYQFDFTTGSSLDTTGPHLIATTPEPTAPGISPFGPFTFQFDKELSYVGNLAVMVTDGTGSKASSAQVTLSADRRSFDVRPQYQNQIAPIVLIHLDPANVFDMAGNPETGTGATTRFITSLLANSHGPHVIGQFPEMNDSAVPTNAMVQLLFDRALYEPSIRDGGIVLEAAGASVTAQPQVSGSLVKLSGVTLLPNTSYRVRITTHLLDTSGVAVEQESVSQFTTTGAPDPDPQDTSTSGPQVSPAPVNAQLVVRSARRLPSFTPLLFNKIVAPTSGTWAFSELAASARLLEDGKTLVLTTRDPLPAWAPIGVDLSLMSDITGAGVLYGGLSFSTSDQIDNDVPAFVVSTPQDGADNVPLNTVPRFVFSEPVGLMTPTSAVRVTKNGDPVAGRLVFPVPNSYSNTAPPDNAIDFKPANPFDPGTDYQIQLDGVLDVAGNAMPPQTIRFHTAADSSLPAGYPKLLRSSTDSGAVDAQDTLVLEYSLPLKPGNTTAGVTVAVPRQTNPPLTFSHPIRTVVSGSTISLTPSIPWPSKYRPQLECHVGGPMGPSGILHDHFSRSQVRRQHEAGGGLDFTSGGYVPCSRPKHSPGLFKADAEFQPDE